MTSNSDIRESIVALSRSYVGVPWKSMGRTRTGIDCVGLVIAVGAEMGLHDYPDDVAYTRQSSGQDLLQPFLNHAIRVPRLRDLQQGDILVMKDAFYPHHVGFLALRGRQQSFIHSSVHQGKVVEDVLTDEVRRLVITGFKFKALA